MAPIRLQHALLPLIARPDDAPFVCGFSVASGYNPETAVESWVFEIGPRYGTRSPIFVSDSVVAVDGQTITVTVPLATISDDDEDLDLADVVALRGCTWSMRARGVDDAFLWRVTGPVDFVDALEWDEESAASIGVPISINLGSGTAIALTILGNTASAGGTVDNAAVNTAIAESPATTRTALGLGTLATQSGTFSGTSSGTNTGDQDLSTLLVKASNLSDLASASTARTNLGLGTLATQSGTFSGTSSGTNTGDQDLSGYVATNDARLSDARAPTAHAAGHISGVDAIQDATASQKGLATAAQIAKLDGIASGATAFNPAIPGAIGGTTPGSGAFTTLSATGQVNSFNGANYFRIQGDYFSAGNNSVGVTFQGGESIITSGFALQVGALGSFSWRSTNRVDSGSVDVALWRESSGHLGVRNSTSAQTFSVANTWTSSTNYERLELAWVGNVACIDTTKGSGGGTLRGLKIGGATTSLLGFYGATPVVQQVLATGAGATADNIISLLQTLGLCKQS